MKQASIKLLTREVVEVGDLYLVAHLMGGFVIPTTISKVDVQGFTYYSKYFSGRDFFINPRGVLVKEQEGRLELLVGPNFLENLDKAKLPFYLYPSDAYAGK
jgi:hypothetical protein